MSTTDERAAALRAELAEIERQEQERAAQERQAAELARREQMAPELAQEASEWEAKANEELEREFPESWKPQKNREHPAQVVGKVIRIEPAIGPSDFGTYSAAIEIVTTAMDRWTVWAPHSGAIYQAMMRLRLQPGEMVAIRYRGKKESQRNPGQSYQDFRLVVLDRENEAGEWIDYEQLTLEAGARERREIGPPVPTDGEHDDIPF